MPASRRYRPSEAPVAILGRVITPGHIVSVIWLKAFMISGLMGEGGALPSSTFTVTLTWSSATTFFSVASTFSTVSSGKMRQFTFAAAS